jgi:hypothetical protein
MNINDLVAKLPEGHDRLRVEYIAATSITTTSWTVASERHWEGSGDPDYAIGEGVTFEVAVADWRSHVSPADDLPEYAEDEYNGRIPGR